MEVIQPMAKKIKLSDAAKDLNIPSQELINYFADNGDAKKKAGSALSEDEMNLVLEHYSKLHEVSSFDEYFASRNEPKPVKKEAPKSEEKPAAKKTAAPKAEKKTDEPKKQTEKKSAEKKSAPKTAEKPVQVQEKKEEPKPVKKEAPKSEEKPVQTQVKSDEKPVQAPAKAEEKPAEKPAEKTAPAPAPKTEQKPAANNKNKKNDKKEKAKAQDRGERTKFNASFSSDTPSASSSQQFRTVDTRGSYIDLDKPTSATTRWLPQISTARELLVQEAENQSEVCSEKPSAVLQEGVRSRKAQET